MSRLSGRIEALESKLHPPRALVVLTNNLSSPEEQRQQIESERANFGFREGDEFIRLHTHYEEWNEKSETGRGREESGR